MSSWFDVLASPIRFYDDLEAKRYTPLAATSILLDGHVHYYEMLAGKGAWLSPDNAKQEAQYAIPSALLRQLNGDPDDAVLLTVVSDRSRDAAERSLACALLAAQTADAGSLHDAVRVLEDFARDEGLTDRERAYIHTHVGFRAVEAGDWAKATDSARTAIELLDAADSLERIADTLLTVNRGNEFWASQYGFGKILQTRRPTVVDAFARIDHLTGNALERDLKRNFDIRFRRNGGSSITFSAEDEVQRQLWGALLRAELLGDFSEVVRARNNLGRYMLASTVGLNERSPDAGFSLLLRGHNAEELARGGTAFINEGPLNAVVRFATALVNREWPPLVVVPALNFLGDAVDVLASGDLDRLVSRLCDDFDKLSRPTALSRADSDALDALASATQVASAYTQGIVAHFALALARSTPDSLILQSLRNVVVAIEWRVQSEEIVENWLNFVRANLEPASDASLLAETVLFILAEVRPREALALARAHSEKAIRLAIVAAAADSLALLTKEEALTAATHAIDALQSTRQLASRGSFTFGGSYDPAALLVSLLLHREELSELWDSLIAFLSDTNVIRADKLRTLLVLTSRFQSVPDGVRRSLSKVFVQIKERQEQVFAVDDTWAFESAVISLGLLLRAWDPDEVFQRILELASNESPTGRTEAARAIVFLDADDPRALTIALLLSRDSNSEVRAAACQALLAKDWGEQASSLIWRRITELLSQGGRQPTLGVLRGLYTGTLAGLKAPRNIASRVEALSAAHPSWLVRKAAGKVSERWRNTLPTLP